VSSALFLFWVEAEPEYDSCGELDSVRISLRSTGRYLWIFTVLLVIVGLLVMRQSSTAEPFLSFIGSGEDAKLANYVLRFFLLTVITLVLSFAIYKSPQIVSMAKLVVRKPEGTDAATRLEHALPIYHLPDLDARWLDQIVASHARGNALDHKIDEWKHFVSNPHGPWLLSTLILAFGWYSWSFKTWVFDARTIFEANPPYLEISDLSYLLYMGLTVALFLATIYWFVWVWLNLLTDEHRVGAIPLQKRLRTVRFWVPGSFANFFEYDSNARRIFGLNQITKKPHLRSNIHAIYQQIAIQQFLWTVDKSAVEDDSPFKRFFINPMRLNKVILALPLMVYVSSLIAVTWMFSIGTMTANDKIQWPIVLGLAYILWGVATLWWHKWLSKKLTKWILGYNPRPNQLHRMFIYAPNGEKKEIDFRANFRTKELEKAFHHDTVSNLIVTAGLALALAFLQIIK
jgi:hypothetical protein